MENEGVRCSPLNFLRYYFIRWFSVKTAPSIAPEPGTVVSEELNLWPWGQVFYHKKSSVDNCQLTITPTINQYSLIQMKFCQINSRRILAYATLFDC